MIKENNLFYIAVFVIVFLGFVINHDIENYNTLRDSLLETGYGYYNPKNGEFQLVKPKDFVLTYKTDASFELPKVQLK